ncbi:MAG: hypothetical protein R6U96_03405 [Promethearchaeia archaeon]
MTEKPKEPYYGLRFFIGALIFAIFCTIMLFGNYFTPEIVHFKVFGVNILDSQFWLLMSVWLIIMLILIFFIWLGFLLVIKPLREKFEEQ